MAQKKLKVGLSVQPVGFAALGSGCSRSVTCPRHARDSMELAKRARESHKGVTCASTGLVGAVKGSIDNTKYPRLAV